MKREITQEMLIEYEKYLFEEEKSTATVKKYMRDIQKLVEYIEDREVDKNQMIAYKDKLLNEDHYKVTSVNSYLVAANRFLEYMGWHDAKVKTYKIQRESFCSENRYLSKEEYRRLVKAAKESKDMRLALIVQTICATGIRISELEYITVENIKKGKADIRCKGKSRTIIIPEKLMTELRLYAVERKIMSGSIFVSKSGKKMNRTTIWRQMKRLCESARVDEEKVFPHNLRHLFAKCFYNMKKDIGKLADILGHSSIETTRIYIRTTWEEHRRELECMDLLC